ncbi:hypothetical protein V6N13_149174 [Hibiscus sabdariffa]
MGSLEEEPCLLEDVNPKSSGKESRHGKTAINMSSSLLRKKSSDLPVVSAVRRPMHRHFLANLQEVVLGTKLSVVFPVIPLAFVAQYYGFGRSWVFALSLLGVSALAERISFLTEQISFYIGPTVGGLVNATCGNAPELIIAIFALRQNKLDMVKYSLLGSVLSNMLLVLGTSLFCGGIANLRKGQKFDREQEDEESEEVAVIGFWSAILWLIGLTALVSLLSEYIVETIEDASNSWGISVSFNSMILLPVVGNAPEHAGAIIFAFKDKLDISLGVALGSATQISMLVVPLCVVAAWIMGINMDLNFNLLETGSLAVSIVAVAFTLQDGNSHYLKGLILILLYSVIGACFFVSETPLSQGDVTDSATKGAIDTIFRA